MKILSINQSVKEFNEDLIDGIEHGFVLSKEDNEVLIELCANLIYYLKYFITSNNVEKENRN